MKHELQATSYELRLKNLYEYAKICKDTKLLNCLGFITTDYIEDKNALPLSIYRIRKIIEDISFREHAKIQKIESELSKCFQKEISNKMVKSASSKKSPIFRRVS